MNAKITNLEPTHLAGITLDDIDTEVFDWMLRFAAGKMRPDYEPELVPLSGHPLADEWLPESE